LIVGDLIVGDLIVGDLIVGDLIVGGLIVGSLIVGSLSLWGLNCGEFQFLRKQNETQVCVVGKRFPNYTACLGFPAGILVPVRRAARWLSGLVRAPRGLCPHVDVNSIR